MVLALNFLLFLAEHGKSSSRSLYSGREYASTILFFDMVVALQAHGTTQQFWLYDSN